MGISTEKLLIKYEILLIMSIKAPKKEIIPFKGFTLFIFYILIPLNYVLHSILMYREYKLIIIKF